MRLLLFMGWYLIHTAFLVDGERQTFSRRACLDKISTDAKRYINDICKAQVRYGNANVRNMASNMPAGSQNTGSTKTFNSTMGGNFPRQLPNSTYDERVTFLKGLLTQGQDGTLLNATSPCGPWTEYFDFTVQILTYMMGNVGGTIGRLAGTGTGIVAGTSIGQSGALPAAAAASVLGTAAEETTLEQATQGSGQQRRRQQNSRNAEIRKTGETRRKRRQQAPRPVDDATLGLAAGSGIGLGTGFAIGTPVGMAAGRTYGERLGRELALWIINNVNFAIAYFGTLVVADVMNGIDIVVTYGVNSKAVRKILRSQIQGIEDQIFQEFAAVYNATVYQDFRNFEIESIVFYFLIKTMRSVGLLFGLAGGMPAGAALGSSSGGAFGSGGAGMAGGLGESLGSRKRKAQTASLAEDLAAIDPLVAVSAATWAAVSIGIGSGTAIGVGAGMYGGWQLSKQIGYSMGLLVVKFIVRLFTVLQQLFGQVVVNQIEGAIQEAAGIAINITYTPTCDFSNYTYPIKNISFYDVSRPSSLLSNTMSEKGAQPAAMNEAERTRDDGAKEGLHAFASLVDSLLSAPVNADAGEATTQENQSKEEEDLIAAFLQSFAFLSPDAAAKGTSSTSAAFFTKTPQDFFQPDKAGPGAKKITRRDAFIACRDYAKSEMYREKALCYS